MAFRYDYYSFREIIREMYTFAGEILTSFYDFCMKFFTPLTDWVPQISGEGLLVDFINRLLDTAWFGDMSLASITLGVGLITFIVVAVIKFFLGILFIS